MSLIAFPYIGEQTINDGATVKNGEGVFTRGPRGHGALRPMSGHLTITGLCPAVPFCRRILALGAP